MSKIEWTEKTWNAMVGCSKVSAGCDHCYAMSDSPHRFADKYDRPDAVVLRGKAKRPGLTFVPQDQDGKSLGKGAQWTGEVRLLPHMLEVPLRRRKPTIWFVNSLSDVFHESVVDSEEGRRFIAAMLGVMAACPQHTFQILTKRPHKAREWFAWLDSGAPDSRRDGLSGSRTYGGWWAKGSHQISRGHAIEHLDDEWHGRMLTDSTEWPLPNVWIGTSVEDQAYGVPRIEHLRRTCARRRFLSIEPLLEDLGKLDLAGIAWVIVGGESGPKARPMHPQWVRDIRDQCASAGVAFFFKQWGAWALDSHRRHGWTAEQFEHRSDIVWSTIAASTDSRRVGDRIPNVLLDGKVFAMQRVGKKAAGRVLDGRTHDDMPEMD